MDRLENLEYIGGGACGTRPTESIAATNWAAEPSMIGISGPSISTSALSTPRPASAAIRCSTVATVAPVAIAEHGAERGLRDVRPFRLDQALAPVGRPVRKKTTPESTSAG